MIILAIILTFAAGAAIGWAATYAYADSRIRNLERQWREQENAYTEERKMILMSRRYWKNQAPQPPADSTPGFIRFHELGKQPEPPTIN